MAQAAAQNGEAGAEDTVIPNNHKKPQSPPGQDHFSNSGVFTFVVPNQFDAAQMQSQTQPSLLDRHEQDYLAQFFDNPNTAEGNIPNFNIDWFMASKSDNSSGGGAWGGLSAGSQVIHDPTTSLSLSSGQLHGTHSANDLHLPISGHMNRQVTHQTSHDPNDITAANLLSSMSSINQDRAQAQAPNFSSDNDSMWSSFRPQNPLMPVAGSQAGSSGSPPANFTPTTPTFDLTYHQQQLQNMISQDRLSHFYPSQQYRQQHANSLHMNNGSLQVDTNASYAYFPQQQEHMQMSPANFSHGPSASRAPLMRFGSDSNFGAYGYQGPNYGVQEHDKGRNLMNVPLANQAAEYGHSPASGIPSVEQQQIYQQQSRPTSSPHPYGNNPSPNVTGGLPHASPVIGAHQHGHPYNITLSLSAERLDDPQDKVPVRENAPPRKRRKTQTKGDDDEAEYVPPISAHQARGASSSRRGPKVPKAESPSSDNDNERAPSVTARPSSKHGRSHDHSHESARASIPSAASTSPSAVASPSAAASSGARKKTRGTAKSRQNLSDEQKRDNHIRSEQKRRDLIKEGYADLEQLVPGLGNGVATSSKSEILFEAAAYLESTVAGNVAMMQMLNVQFSEVDYNKGERNDVDIDNDNDANTESGSGAPAISACG